MGKLHQSGVGQLLIEREGAKYHMYFAIDTVGQDRELQDKLNIEEK